MLDEVIVVYHVFVVKASHSLVTFLLVMFFSFFFFFSSRRRHTRSLRDWSSDVCSSDLGMARRDDQGRRRIVVEKPFGTDLKSATELNLVLQRTFGEDAIFRIDHYLGKETVQNILAFRFANAIFEPIWSSHYVDSVQITVAEELGVEHRAAYYEKAGALRDIMQNHALQLLTLVAMEPAVAFDAVAVRDEKVKVLRSIRPLRGEEITRNSVRGQYGEGW